MTPNATNIAHLEGDPDDSTLLRRANYVVTKGYPRRACAPGLMRSVKDNSSRRKDQDGTRLVAVKTQTIGLGRLGGKRDDVGLIHLMTIH